MKQIYLNGLKYFVSDTMEISKITGQNKLDRAQLVPRGWLPLPHYIQMRYRQTT